MLDIKYIRENQESLKTAIANKQFDPNLVDQVITVDDKRRSLLVQVENLRKEVNQNSQGIKGNPSDEQIKLGRDFKAKLAILEPELTKVEKEFQDLMYQ